MTEFIKEALGLSTSKSYWGIDRQGYKVFIKSSRKPTIDDRYVFVSEKEEEVDILLGIKEEEE